MLKSAGVRVDPDGAAAGVVEAGEDTHARVAGAGQDERQRISLVRSSDGGSEALVDGCRRRGRVAERAAAVDALDCDREPATAEAVDGSGIDEALRPLARAVAVVAGVVGNLDETDGYRGGRTRTCNPRFWRPVLCQLSYAPRVAGRL